MIWPIGVLFALFGVYIMLQARLPMEKRRVRAGKGGRGPILGKRQCIRSGAIFAILGIAVALEGIGIRTATPHVFTAVALAIIVIIVSSKVSD